MSIEELVHATAGAAERLGIFDHRGTRDEIARAVSLVPTRLGPSLDLLAAAGWLARTGDAYEATRRGDPLAPSAKLVEKVLRRDRPLDLSEIVGSVDAARLTCHAEIVRAPHLVTRLVDLVGDGVLLDAGCGDGSIAQAVLAAAPRARARLVDLDTRHARRLASSRIEVRAADLRSITARARVVLLSNVIHMHEPATARALLAHAKTLVEPGGTLVVHEIALDDDRRGPLTGLAFAASLSLHGTAELPTQSELVAWTVATSVERAGDSIVLEAGAS